MAGQTKARLLPACLAHCWSLCVYGQGIWMKHETKPANPQEEESTPQPRSLDSIVSEPRRTQESFILSRLRLLLVRMQAARVHLCTNPNDLGRGCQEVQPPKQKQIL